MADLRILAAGDNHGNIDSLEQMVAQTEGEEFDYIIHTGDLTNTYKQDFRTGVEQLQAIEPYFEALAERGTFIYIFGNRDAERGVDGGRRHVTDEYELDPGHRLHQGESLTLDGQRFTTTIEDTEPSDILITHGENIRAFYDPPGRAYFCGDTHSARQIDTALNTGYLFKKQYQGAYYTATLSEDGMTVAVHSLSEPWCGLGCADHSWYGRQFAPEKFGCEICKFGPGRLFRGMAHYAFGEATADADSDSPTAEVDAVVDAGRELFVDSDAFADQFQDYLLALAEKPSPHPLDPLHGVEGHDALLQQ